MSENPYQAPTVQEVVAPAAPLTGAEEIRNRHLKHEASIKAIGLLFLVGGVLLALSLVNLVAMYGSISTRTESPVSFLELIMFGMPPVVCIAQFIAGWGLRRLRPWGKIPAALLAGLSLFSLPVGTLIGSYILYLLFSEKGRVVLSPAYAEIVAQTPHLRYRTPRWIWIALVVIVLLLLGFAIFSAAMG